MEKAKVESVEEEPQMEFVIKHKAGSDTDDSIEEFSNKNINVKTKNSKSKCIIEDEKDCIRITCSVQGGYNRSRGRVDSTQIQKQLGENCINII